MNTTIRTTARAIALTGILVAAAITTTVAQSPATAGCADVGTPAVPGMADHSAHDTGTPAMEHGMNMSTPGAMHDDAAMSEVEFDLMYIDMMIPHHESIMALAEVALLELEDPRLQEIAQAILDTQGAEIEQLQQLRTEWYGDVEPVGMDMMHGMPGMSGDMTAMEQQMSVEWQVQAFCSAPDKDLAFIDQVIPHHQMAIDTSNAAPEHAVHPELKAIAENVIAAQQQEIDELEAIRVELSGEATPTS